VEVSLLQHDRLAVRRAIGRVVPGVLITRERRRVGDALLGDQPLKRVQPVPIVGLAGVGIGRGLRALNLLPVFRARLRGSAKIARRLKRKDRSRARDAASIRLSRSPETKVPRPLSEHSKNKKGKLICRT
jgi:hypothetical protein